MGEITGGNGSDERHRGMIQLGWEERELSHCALVKCRADNGNVNNGGMADSEMIRNGRNWGVDCQMFFFPTRTHMDSYPVTERRRRAQGVASGRKWEN